MDKPNKLIEMARNWLDDRDWFVGAGEMFIKPIEAEQALETIADFAQHVLDKQWTRTEDGLPTESDTYLFTVKLSNGDFLVDPYFIKDGECFIDRTDYDEDPLDGDKIDPKVMVAWMPVPKPFVESEEVDVIYNDKE